jgi:hypothetical protein
MNLKIYTLLIIALLYANNAVCSDYLKDVENLGYVSGEGLACGAQKYPSYETIARAYMVSSAKSDKEQADGMYMYNKAKVKGYTRKKRSGLIGCDEVNIRFNNQKILQSKLYKNGTIKLPDGKVIKPRKEYDASLLYDKSEDERSKMNSLYNKIQNKKKKQAQKEGIFQKFKEFELKNRKY